MTAFLQASGKQQILKELLIICVRDSRVLFGRNLRVVFVMRSSPGAFFLRRLLMIFWMVPGVVNNLELVVLRFCSDW